MPLIGVVGFAGAGKDSVGEVLVKHAGFKRVAFADRMKLFALALDPYIPIEVMPSSVNVNFTPIIGQPVQQPETVTRFRRLSKLVEEVGWDVAKKNPEVRRFLQKLGTEGGRRILGENIWVDAAIQDMTESTVVTDVRFLNEAAAIREIGGVIWRVERPGVNPANNHPSEMEQKSIEADRTIKNDGTLEDLEETVLLTLHAPTLRVI